MRLNRLDLNLLVALDALLTEKSITRAADQICLSQPATSGALARLREFFEDELLCRNGAHMVLTPLGESLKIPVHNILMQIQTTVERRLEFEPASSERCFRVLLSDYTSTTLMAKVVRQISDIAPRMKLELIAPTNDPQGKLEQGNIDFLIMPEKELSDKHPKAKLFDEDFVVIGCQNNPFLEIELTQETYLSLSHVSVRFGSQRKRSQDQIILEQQYGIVQKVDVVTSTFASIPQFLPGTNRIATVYRHLAEEWVNFLPLKIMPVPLLLSSIPWGIQWHSYRDLDPAIHWLKSEILKVVEIHYETSKTAPL
ncbi:LysR family transcriptional regulator [Marinomonas mediterranea]|jgi:Transcriptional regulator|uniref:Transcriptional regulator, LysR family n=1 Tax=Marinomonas mediterranea (strain ATCC 700492 / JCM 21426 / NBRC 103028 / MMB-1) TaxID=717774 RepID=F2K2E0_MARM1|nr:LysR family transcriptional regulator [Marinomonas mediterranea]ADZ92320.1 transcriptional regulator, LysR family [Marinomonas mediterranea MMB-1]WCN10272.1 LysR family transcriptional regulator [Marinomonas mediterranea]WCN14319.1 LysR family transcriptional regulator [Marinomonas mediterranea]WCN18371.1 LysR family transcriptional regulator [Marinomonas mediterranea MMB-1]